MPDKDNSIETLPCKSSNKHPKIMTEPSLSEITSILSSEPIKYYIDKSAKPKDKCNTVKVLSKNNNSKATSINSPKILS